MSISPKGPVIFSDYSVPSLPKLSLSEEVERPMNLLSESFSFSSSICISSHLSSPDLFQDDFFPLFSKDYSLDRMKEIIVIPDIHGEFDALQEILQMAGVVDPYGHWTKDCKSKVVQLGDVIDRGPYSLDTYEYLGKLQKEAQVNGGELIRLLGNHELFLLQKYYGYAQEENVAYGIHAMSDSDIWRLRRKIINDLKHGDLLIAWSDGVHLYTHAGLRSRVRLQLCKEIRKKKRNS